jgi:hypothetical protein
MGCGDAGAWGGRVGTLALGAPCWRQTRGGPRHKRAQRTGRGLEARSPGKPAAMKMPRVWTKLELGAVSRTHARGNTHTHHIVHCLHTLHRCRVCAVVDQHHTVLHRGEALPWATAGAGAGASSGAGSVAGPSPGCGRQSARFHRRDAFAKRRPLGRLGTAVLAHLAGAGRRVPAPAAAL